MYVTGGPDDLLEGVIIALQNDILPELTSQRAQVAAVMMQAVLQQVRQTIPAEQQIMALEHNEIAATYRDMAAILGTTAGPEADRIRALATTLGAHADIPVPLPYNDIRATYNEMSHGLVDTVRDLDVLIREGSGAAEDALLRMRVTMGARIARDFSTMFLGAGMAGRG
jgi:hypothetical protein